MSVVLIHAFPLDDRMWEPQVDALADEDVYVPYLYGLGGNSVDGWAEHVLERTEGELLVVGASLGGYVALAMARISPARVGALLLAGARAAADPPERRALRDEMINVVRAEGIAGWNREFSPPGPEDRTTEELIQGIEALRDRRDVSEFVAEFDKPLVLVVGDQDEILSVDEARQIVEAAPQGRLEVVEGAGHLVSVDAPERFNAILQQLLQRAG
jgi:pimeloyl-ACP methyl ester carboxylesterase